MAATMWTQPWLRCATSNEYVLFKPDGSDDTCLGSYEYPATVSSGLWLGSCDFSRAAFIVSWWYVNEDRPNWTTMTLQAYSNSSDGQPLWVHSEKTVADSYMSGGSDGDYGEVNDTPCVWSTTTQMAILNKRIISRLWTPRGHRSRDHSRCLRQDLLGKLWTSASETPPTAEL